MRRFRILPKYIICKRAPLNASEFCTSRLLNNKLFFFHNYFKALPLTSHSNATNVADSVQTLKLSLEQEYFENVIKNNPDYTVQVPADDLLEENRISTNKLVMVMRNLTRTSDIFDDEINFLSKDFLDSSFTVDDINEILIRLPLSTVDDKHKLGQLEKLLNTKIHALCKKDKLDKLLKMLHLLKNYHKLKFFGSSIINYLFGRQRSFTKSQLIKYYYTLHFFTTFNIYKSMSFNMDIALSERLADMTMDEIAIIVYALFRCKISTRYMCCTAVAKKLLEDFEHVNAVQASVLSKFLGVNADHRLGKIISDILEKFSPIMSDFPLLPAIRVALVGTRVNVVNADLMKQVIKRVLIAPECLRLKDYERLLLAASVGNIDLRLEPDFVQLVTKHVKQRETRETETMRHPLSYVSILSRLTLHEIYLDEEYRFVFSEDYQKLLKKKSRKSLHELLYLDVALQLERPDYVGNRLSDQQRHKIAKMDFFGSSNSSNTAISKCNYDIKKYLFDIYGVDCCVIRYLMPHFCILNAVLCVNKKNEPQEIGNRLDAQIGRMVRAPKDGNLWICFLLVRHPGCLWNSVIPHTGTLVKIKQLKLAGYHPLMIMLHEWNKKTNEEKQLFLKKIIWEEVDKFNGE